MGMMEEFYRKVAADKQRGERAEAELEAARLDIVLAERERRRLALENANLRNEAARHWQTSENLAASCNAAREAGEELLGWLKAARSERDSARALLRELAAEIRPIFEMNTRDLGGILCGAGGGHRQWLMEKAISHVLLLLRRAEAEATEESEQKMNLQQALAILAREKHNGHTRWDGTCPPSSAAWRTEFEVIAIAEAYEQMRGPDPCAALRARLENAEAESADLQRLSEARFQRNNALECSNKEQEADLAATRARLESAERERDALKVQLAKQTRIVEQLNATRNRREDDIDALHEDLHRREQAR